MEQLTDLISELAVLSACINHGSDCYLDISEIVNADTFSDDQAKALWKCLTEIYKDGTKKADLPSILTTAKRIGLDIFFNSDDKQKTLSRIIRFQSEPENALSFAKKISKLSIARELDQKFDLAKKEIRSINGTEPISAIIAKAEKPVLDTVNRVFGKGYESEIKHLSEGLDDLVLNIENNPNRSFGIPSGFPEWDESIGDALAPGVHVIGARSKGGKSYMVNNMGAKNIAYEQNIPVLALDTELKLLKHQLRLLSLFSDVDIKSIKRGWYLENKKEKEAVHKAKEILKTIPYDYVSTSGRTIDEMLGFMRRWLIRRVGYDSHGNLKPAVIFFDYLRISDASELNALKEYQVLGLYTSALHTFTVQYNIPIVMLVQLNRDGISEESTAAVGGSDRILHSCSSLTYLKSKSPDEIAKDGPELGNKKLVVVASRDGEGHSDGQYIHLGTQLSKSKIWELGSTTRPKKMKQVFDTEQVQEIPF